MRLEDEIKTDKFQSETHKAQLNILFSATWLRNRISASLKPHGITQEQFNVLRIIRGHKQEAGMLAKDIAARMLERNSNTTRIIDRLELKKLVQRLVSEKDRRERPVVLTKAGAKLLANIDAGWQANNPHTAPWTTEEAQLVNKLLDKMRDDF